MVLNAPISVFHFLFPDDYWRHKGESLSAKEIETRGRPEGLLWEAACACHPSVDWRDIQVNFSSFATYNLKDLHSAFTQQTHICECTKQSSKPILWRASPPLLIEKLVLPAGALGPRSWTYLDVRKASCVGWRRALSQKVNPGHLRLTNTHHMNLILEVVSSSCSSHSIRFMIGRFQALVFRIVRQLVTTFVPTIITNSVLHFLKHSPLWMREASGGPSLS